MAVPPLPARSRVDPPLAGDAVDAVAVARRARLGSAVAFEQLVRLYGVRLHRFLVLRLGSDRDARDVLQETLIAAWQGLPALEQPDRIWPWLAGIAAHKAADSARRTRRAPAALELEPAAREDPELVGLWAALAALPGRLREVLLLRYLLSLSEAETAAVLGVRVGTVKSRTARARQALEELLR